MDMSDDKRTEIIYRLFGNLYIKGIGGEHGSNYIGDFINSKILYGRYDKNVFEELGEKMYELYKREVGYEERMPTWTYAGDNRFIRLAKVEKQLQDLLDEVKCIRNND